MKPEFLHAINEVIGNIDHIHIEESGADSLVIHHDDVQKLKQIAEMLESKKFHSVFRQNETSPFITVINR